MGYAVRRVDPISAEYIIGNVHFLLRERNNVYLTPMQLEVHKIHV